MSSSKQINSKRIVKNTLFMYFRMLVTMGVGLYTSRVVLESLGVENYGLYHVVGGIVVVLSFINGAMTTSTQRFLNFELGKGNAEGLRKVFSSSLIIHFGIAVIVVVLAESVGLFFLNKYMNISPERVRAANWVFQFSVAAAAIKISSIPYSAAIVAHEKMSAFAYVSILEACLKLCIAFLVRFTGFDRLIFYAFLIFLLGLILCFAYAIYCKLHFEECQKIFFAKDKAMFKGMLSFSSWTILGNLAYIFHTQGLAIIINLFFAATVNAAQGIANQVNGAVNGFVQNFMIAMKPQVVKSYASGDLKGMQGLLISGSKFSFFLVLVFVVPLTMETPRILNLWLKEVPDYTIIFIRLLLFTTLFNSFNSLLNAAKGATGNIKVYMIVQTSIDLLLLPLSYMLFKLGFAPYYAMVVYLILVAVMQITRIAFVCNAVNLSMLLFYKKVVVRCSLVFAIAYAFSFIFKICILIDLLSIFITLPLYIFLSLMTIYFIGMDGDEKKYLKNIVVSRLKKEIKNDC